MKNKIRELRLQNKIRQIELCQQLGISQATLSLWENGKFEPDHNALIKLSQIFEVSVDYLLNNSGDDCLSTEDSEPQIWMNTNFFQDKKIMRIGDSFGPLGLVVIITVFHNLVKVPEGMYFWNLENADVVLNKINKRPDEQSSLEHLNDIIQTAVEIGIFDKNIFDKTTALVPTTKVISRYRPIEN